MSEHVVNNSPKKEFLFALVGVGLFLGIVLLIGISAFLRPAGEHITAEPTAESVAADEAAKTAIVDLIELRIARGMCGKSYMLLTGEVAAVEAAIEKAKEAIKDRGMFLDSSVIAHPDAQIRDAIL